MSNGPEDLENLLVKARRSFEVAEILLEGGQVDFAASRSFFTPPGPCFSPKG